MTHRSAVSLASWVIVLALAGSTHADVFFDRAFGVDVDPGGGTGFENCTTATGCQVGADTGVAGAFSGPTGIAVDAQGRILVADQNNNRVNRFVVADDGTVSFDRGFGVGVAGGGGFENCTAATGCQAVNGSGAAGGLNSPFGIALDAEGRILVSDESDRVSRFVTGGDGTVSFDRAFGFGVQTGTAAFENCTTATGCQPGAIDTAAGALDFPRGLAVDAQGRILVVEGENRRVSRFVVAGDGTVSFDRAFGFGVHTGAAAFENCTTATGCQPGTASGDAGALAQPRFVALDAQGRILVSDRGTRRVSRFGVAGDGTVSFDRAFGLNVDPAGGTGFENCTTATGCQAGTANTAAAGGFQNPAGIAVDHRGRILVVDPTHNRASRFVVAGDDTVSFDRAFGLGVDTGANVFENCTIATTCQAGISGGAAGALGVSTGIAVDAKGRILVTSSLGNRVDRFIMYGVTYDGNGATGGTVPVDDSTDETGDPVTVAANTGALVRTNHTLAGWNTQADGGGTSYAASGADTFAMGTADVTLFARWTPNPDLTIAKSHAGAFSRGQVGATYQITVTNTGIGPTTAQVTVTDALPAGLTATAIAGTGWNCVLATLTCTRADALAASAAYPVIVVTVTADANAPIVVTNTATVSGGGDVNPANDTAADPTAIVPADVAGHPFLQWIAALIEAGITTGCSTSPPLYCPEATVSRAQIAVFLLRGIHGAGYSPPAPTGVFTDVPVTGDPGTTHPFAAWIEQLAAEGITSGCGGGAFCPAAGVSRAQMAVFLLRAKHGAGYQPPAPNGLFADVPVTGDPATTHPLAAWIEQLAAEGITSGCGGGLYCPGATVTRGEMAVFLARAFGLPL